MLLLASGAAVAADPIRVANEGGIKNAWMLAPGAKLAAPAYPPQFASRGLDVCVSIGYLINADGSTSDFALLDGWNSETNTREPEEGFWAAFAQASGAALQQWRFQPRPEIARPTPVYTVATMSFGKPGATASPELRQRCKIADLHEHLSIIRADPGKRRQIDVHLFDRMQLDRDDYD